MKAMDDKKFLTYEEQISLLRDKKLIIDDEDEAVKLLKKYSYFTLINGYKKPFKNKEGFYKNGTKLKDIYSLYKFDDELRHTLMKYILMVELHIKSLLSYSFCEKFGENQSEYQNALNYNYTIQELQKPINELIQTLGKKVEESDKVIYVNHQSKKHFNIPLWVLVKTLTLGNISKMYTFQQDCIKSKISHEFPVIRENDLAIMLDILTRYRNVCAHNEKLFDFKYYKNRMKMTKIHKAFSLYTTNQKPSNLFDVIIILKYLLDSKDFVQLIDDMEKTINKLSNETNQIQRSQLLKLMGFPQNWENIKMITWEETKEKD